MKFIKNNWRKIVIFSYFFIIPIISFAVDDTTPSSIVTTLDNPLGSTSTLPKLIQDILEGVIKIGFPIIALAIIYCGFLFVAARGSSEKLTKAKDALTLTLIGSAVLLGAWAIAKMISATITKLGS